MQRIAHLLVFCALLASCAEEPNELAIDQPLTATQRYAVFAMNRRGMSFPDKDFTVSAIFPPANFLVAQVVKSSDDPMTMPELLDDTEVEVRYSAVVSSQGSMNTASSSKTNFWDNSEALYHFYTGGRYTLEPDEGFHGITTPSQRMPGLNNTPQPFESFDVATSTFTALYVPITPTDDVGVKNYFPQFSIEAIDRSTGELLATTVIPLPMAEPMRCEECHRSGGIAGDELTSQRFGGLAWSDNPDAANNAKENIAILHSLIAGIDLTVRQPYLCAECHYTPIADPDGVGPRGDFQTRRNPLSISVHAWHGLDRDRQLPAYNEQALIPENGEASCKICHGGEQPYTRGPMHQAGLVCQDCHGGMVAVGKSTLVGSLDTRTPFADEPRCESCHTGDEVSHLGTELVLSKAYEADDLFATPRLAINRRFAENPGVLYRKSVAHGGMTCISCHGSPHAEWPVASDETHDNEIPTQLQGHAGGIVECSACHSADLPVSMDGPHGLHNVGDQAWVLEHGSFYADGGAQACQSCHGLALQGSRLSKVASARSYTLPDMTTIRYVEGDVVGCADCHLPP